MKNIKYVLFSIVFVFLLLFGVQINASEWSELSGKYVTDFEDSLSNNIGNAIAETEDGYIWIGQYSGLTKYNGSVFQTISEVNGISLNGVMSLYADGNTLYIGTQNSLVKYENGKFSEIIISSDSVTVNAFSKYEDTLYVATSQGLYAYQNNQNTLLVEGRVSDVKVGEAGGFYVVSDNNINKVYSIKSKKEFYSDYSIKSLYIRGKKLYMGSTTGEVIEYYLNVFTVKSIGSSSAVNTFTYADDLLFIGADDGTYTFDGAKIEKFKRMDVTNSIEAIHMDYQKNLWVVSSSNGIVKISSNPFEDLFTKYGVSDFLYSKLGITKTGVNGIARYKNRLYLATENCLICVNEDTQEIEENSLVNHLLGIRIRAITVFENKLYVGCYSNTYGLVVYDGTSIQSILEDELVCPGDSSTKAGQIRCFAQTGDSLYVGTNYGISRIHNGSITTIKPEYRPLYLYTYGDVLYACIEGAGIETYSCDLDSLGKISGTEGKTILKCLRQDNYLLYAASNNLCVWDIDKKTTRKVHLDVSGSVVEILCIHDQYYIGTDSDIYVINKENLLNENLSYLTLGKGEGLRSGLSSNASGMYDEKRNIYYFASRNSAYSYNLEYNPENVIPSKLAISQIKIDEQTLTAYDSVVLASSANRLTVYFDVLDYTDYNSYKVYYKLEGAESEFNCQSAKELSSITYTNLKGGKYKLIIYAEDANGVRTSNQIELVIDKELAFYEHTYVIVLFVILGIIGLIGASVITAYFVSKTAKKRHNQLRKITEESIEAIARTIDAKDKYTNGHSTRVGKYSKIIAESMNLPQEEIMNIYYIGLLHDIGKIAVSRDILNKPGRLTDEEFAQIKTHTNEGEKILSTISTIPHITEGAKYHHERYDGKGYPDGLAGEEIPFIARIICCADCFDAMATKRSYKEPYTSEKIISEFKRCSGTQFDPAIAKLVVELIETNKLTIEEE